MRATDGAGGFYYCGLPFALSVVKVPKNRLHTTPGGWYGSQQNLGARLLGDRWGKGKEESGHRVILIHWRHIADASTLASVHRAKMRRSV